MDNKQKIIELRTLIEQRLSPLIDRDYVFLDLPYHPNVGDTLIAMAIKEFLGRFPYRCLYESSEFTFDDRPISPDTLIVFNGGGNFGDLWRNYSVFRNKIIRRYPRNRYVIFPQSVWYDDPQMLEEDVTLYASCPDITICARDRVSYDFLNEHFKANNILLVPDMAFYTSDRVLQRARTIKPTGRTLFLRRIDKEFRDSSIYDIVPKEAEVYDWPTMQRRTLPYTLYRYLMWFVRRIEWHVNRKLAYRINDWCWHRVLHRFNLRNGTHFVGRYDKVYTTRLHVAILSVLLDKRVWFFDNSYKKNSALYNTWLTDLPTITLVEEPSDNQMPDDNKQSTK